MPLPRDYLGQNCSIARALELVGDRWTLLVLREVFLGIRRFDDIQEHLGIARNTLSNRLGRLVDDGLLEKVAYQDAPPRYEYRLSEMGRDLWPVVVALMQWGDRYLAPDGPPTVVTHRGCGGTIDDRRICQACGAQLELGDVRVEPGPGAVLAPR